MIDDGTVENILNTTKYIEINHKSDFAELNGNMHFLWKTARVTAMTL